MSRSPPMVVVKEEPLDEFYFPEVDVKDETNDHFGHEISKDYDSESSTNLTLEEQKQLTVKDALPKEKKFHICKFCEKVFYNEEDLNAHISEKHNSDEPFNCEFCDRRFASREYLDLHCMIHEGQQYKCDVCRKKFATMKYRSDHMKTHKSQPEVPKAEPRNIGKITCKYCERHFNSEHALSCHISETHDLYKPYNCDICVRKFTSKGRLDQHLVGTHGAQKTVSSRVECNKKQEKKCTLKFTNTSPLGKREGEQRITRAHATEQKENAECNKKLKKKQLQCDLCKKWFTHKGSLYEHIKNHDRRLECGICKIKFKRRITLTKHLKKHRSQFECDTCGQMFRLKKRLDEHTVTHLPECLRSMCNVCYNKFPTKYLLDTHMAMHDKHEIKNAFDPTKMLTRLEDPTDTSKHSENISARQLPTEHVCQVCNETLTTLTNFDKHMISHRKMLQFTCGICKKVFKLSYYLKIHTRTHTGEKPYECGICDKKFVTAGKLTRHIKTHVGQKHFPCRKCSKRFLSQIDLKRHIEGHGKQNSIVKSLLDIRFLKKI